jgi:hypothetical protein
MFSAAISLLICGSVYAQSNVSSSPVKTNVLKEGGVYKPLPRKKADTSKDTPTGEYYIDRKGTMWPVYKSGKGKLYALRTSEAGNVYKYYLRPSDDDTVDHEGN